MIPSRRPCESRFRLLPLPSSTLPTRCSIERAWSETKRERRGAPPPPPPAHAQPPAWRAVRGADVVAELMEIERERTRFFARPYAERRATAGPWNGAFDPDLYRRLLAANHLTPSIFETMEAKELLTNKARLVVMDAVALTPSEFAEAQTLITRQGETDSAKAAAAKERIFQSFLFQKQQRALMAYAESMKTKVPIKVHKELL